MGLNSKDSVIEAKEDAAAAGYKDSPGICIILCYLYVRVRV